MKQLGAMIALVATAVTTLVAVGSSQQLSIKEFILLVLIIIVVLSIAYYPSIIQLERMLLASDNEPIKEPDETPIVKDANKTNTRNNHKTLTNQDIAFFNEEMEILNESLDIINGGLKSSKSINRVMIKNDRINAIKLWMESLVEEPERLIDASDFVYKQLPMLSDLIEMYLDINSKELLNGEQKLILEESLEAMAIVSDNIKSGFFVYGQKELDSLKEKIEQVKRHNQQRNEGFDNEH